mgnify:FL=1
MDFFQNSYFYPTHQLICIYYTVALVNEAKLQSAEGHIQFVWKNIKDIQPGYLSFPIDQAALEELQKQIQKKL